jgi:hypothetical protein
MATDSERLRLRLEELGLTASAIDAAWPSWWSEDAGESRSALGELRFSLARRLGLDPRSLLEDAEAPAFIWRREARFKHLSGEDELEQAGITSFGRAVSALLASAAPAAEFELTGRSAAELRKLVLARRPFVGLADLLALAWSAGIPVAHLRIFPWERKRMAAMAVRVSDRASAVLLGRDASYPPQPAFYLAHELAHLALGHVGADEQIVDLDSEANPSLDLDGDEEEQAADAFALELLTGNPRPVVLAERPGWASPSELARTSREAAGELRIEPGTLVMSYGFSTGDWQLAFAALDRVYGEKKPIWREVNGVARTYLDLDGLAADSADFLDSVLGEAGPPPAGDG